MSISKAYDSWSSQYDTNLNKIRDLNKKATTQTLSNYEFKNVLELGCGTGKNTEWFVKDANKIIALDFSEKMLNIAKAKVSNRKVIFQTADLNQKWDVKDDFAELISVNLVLEHIKNLDFIFSQVFQKLKVNGIFFICELHPFKQYSGSKARYETDNGVKELEVYTHHISEYLKIAKNNNLKLIELNEWFDEDNNEIPRLISFVFKRN